MLIQSFFNIQKQFRDFNPCFAQTTLPKVLLFVVILHVFPVFLLANPVDSTQAKAIASGFFRSKAAESKSMRAKAIAAASSLRLAYQESEQTSQSDNSADNQPCFYIFNIGTGNGFVIVSGEDSSLPVLGYTDEGTFDAANQPPAFREWMAGYKAQIKYLRSAGVKGLSASVTSLADIVSVPSTRAAISEVSPMITATWDQGCYYNSLCPTTSQGPCGGYYVGCVAVAMAQVMNYWQAPYKSTYIPGYTSTTMGLVIPTLASTTHNWSYMDDKLTGTTAASRMSEVAKLLYYCGVAVKMDYAPGSSGAYMTEALNGFVKYFKYSSAMRWCIQSNYTQTSWINLIKNELNNQRPVIYAAAQSTGGAHAFVCDGYQSTGYFHMNWGWNGTYNGYFSLSSLRPGSFNFNVGHNALINIVPTLTISPAQSTLTSDTLSKTNYGTFAITSNSSWVASSDQNWLKIANPVGNESDVLKFYTNDNNSSGVTRVATITVKIKNNLTQEFKITQLSSKPTGTLTVYPNPCIAGQLITADINDLQTSLKDYKIEAYSDKGMMMQEVQSVSQKTSFRFTKRGTYIISLKHADGRIADTRRLIVK